jgi:GntR family transcriptional regulator
MKSANSNSTAGFRFRLDLRSGVPVYRQLIDQVKAGMASGTLASGDQLPTVRQLAVDLAINPNTVLRAYRELELVGLLETQQGMGTFITGNRPPHEEGERERQLRQLAGEFLARAGEAGFTAEDLLKELRELVQDQSPRR